MKLRVFLPPTERPDPAERCAWKLFDTRGELRREGEGISGDMPRAKELELVLPAERVLFARLKLPRVNAATIRELLPFAVEDRLLGDPAHIHAVAGAKNARGETVVAVIDRDWLMARIAALEAAGHAPTSAFCESALLAGGHGDWHVVWGSSRSMLVDDEGVGASFDRGPGLPLALRVALDEAAARGDKPASVRVHSQGGEPLPDLARWSSEKASVAPGSSGKRRERQPAARASDPKEDSRRGARVTASGSHAPRSGSRAIVAARSCSRLGQRLSAERDRLVQRLGDLRGDFRAKASWIPR